VRCAPLLVVLIAALSVTAAACSDGAREASLVQVGDATRPGLLPDAGSDTPANDTAQADTDPLDSTAAESGDSAPDIGPSECTADVLCIATACTTGRCVDGACVFALAGPGTTCDDGDPCTPVDTCQGTTCAGSGLLACDDQDPCTNDRCSPGVGCDFAPKVCDDANTCTTDACRAGVGCVSTPITCAPTDVACSVSACDPAVGCTTVAAADGAACDDGRVCTLDVCSNGACVTSANGCDDGNGCTSDGCLPEGGCDFVPVQGCANEDECIGRVAGAACNDSDPTTSADMCIAGNCHGYTLTRIPGTTVTGEQGLVVSEIDDGPEGWTAVFWTIDFLTNQSWLLAGLTTATAPVLYTNTLSDARIAGLRDGFAGNSDGRLWRLDGGQWSSDHVWDTALGASGRDVINAIFTVHGADLGVSRTRLAWIVGGDESGWLRLCKQSDGAIVCSAQVMGDGDPVPRAIAGVPTCDGAADCTGAALVSGADTWLGGGFNYSDAYENPTGLAPTWQVGYRPDAPGNRATHAAAAWSDDAGVRALVVGDNGYLLLRRGDGSWRGPLFLRDGQTSRDFSGAWVGAGVVIVSAHRLGSNGTVVHELWVAPRDSDLERGGNWIVHELGRFPDVEAAGLYDVAGKTDGEVRVVGAVRRTNDLFDWLDGAVWVRPP